MALPSQAPPGPVFARRHAIARWPLAAIYLAAGLFHLSIPGTFLMITPDWVPFRHLVIIATGLCEIAGAIALNTRLRRAAGVALALYAICVYPANIKHALYGLPAGQMQLGWWYHAPRLALQPVLVWWALYAGDVIEWPFARAAPSFGGASAGQGAALDPLGPQAPDPDS
ncbi:DoxX family protein [Lichenicoccus sp.]|uniref:DoxX family protein n=1 Tax=Lichenicoccus sp. TaxID=2781899 RepID=UPI003D0D3100